MHICHIITRLIIGGAQENTLLTCRGLAQRGHRVTLIAGPETGPEGSLWSDAENAGCELITLDSMRRAVNPLRDRRARNELSSLLRKAKPDVVHTHSSKAGILGRSAAARAGVPVIVHTIHGMSFNRTQPYWLRSAYRMLERRAARHTTAFVSVADAMTDQAVAAGLAPRDRFVTIRSGMETDRYRPDAELRARIRKETSKRQNRGKAETSKRRNVETLPTMMWWSEPSRDCSSTRGTRKSSRPCRGLSRSARMCGSSGSVTAPIAGNMRVTSLPWACETVFI